MDYSITLEKYNGPRSRFPCPICKAKPNSFTRYIDLTTNQYIAPAVGICGKVNSCGFSYSPREYFNDNYMTLSNDQKVIRAKAIKTLPKRRSAETSYLPISVVKKSLHLGRSTTLMTFLSSLFDEDIVNQVAAQYLLGGFQLWESINPVFWQIDHKGNVRTGKLMKYDSRTGKRIKKPYNHINWMHSVLKIKPYNLSQCLYGSHIVGLPKNKNKIISIVESEKSALICAICFPDSVWLATGGLQNLKKEKLEAISGRKILLYPDNNAYQVWCDKANELSDIIPNINISDIMERQSSTSHFPKGSDLADLIVKEVSSK